MQYHLCTAVFGIYMQQVIKILSLLKQNWSMEHKY